MEKKKYLTNQRFLVIYAISIKEKRRDHFTVNKIDSITLGLYDTIIEKNGELSDGEVALALSDSLNSIYSHCSSDTQVTLVNWWAI